MSILRVLVLCLTLALSPQLAKAAEAAPAAPDAPAPPPAPAAIDDLLHDPVISQASISPDGRYLAIANVGDHGRLTITDLTTDKTVPILPLTATGAGIKGLSVDWMEWKNDNRLLLGMSFFNIQREGGSPTGRIVGFTNAKFMFATDRDGKNVIQILKGGGYMNANRGLRVSLIDRLDSDPDHVLAEAQDNQGMPAVWKVNVQTGEAKVFEPGDLDTYAWEVDSTGAVAVRYRYRGDVTIEGRPTGQRGWSLIKKIRENYFGELSDFSILGATDKPAQFYVAVKPKDPSEGDNWNIRIYDVAAKSLSPPIWAPLHYDLTNIVYDGRSHDLIGVCYTSEVYTCDFKDPVLERNYQALQTYFEHRRNIVPLSITDDQRYWLLEVSGPDEPGSYYLFDTKSKEIELAAERYRNLPAESLATMEPWSYPARDGVSIPAYLSQPPGLPPGPAPLIVMPHGGPEVRDTFGFDPWVQYMALQGYLVFQPNFRGSGGYGVAYGAAGYRQWDGRMADDITDGVRKLIAEGKADPKRICIFGGSYGGYAALLAGAQHPELYKCVVSVAGLSDLIADFRHEKSLGKDTERYKYWVKAIGDPDTQADALKKASPITYAATYQPPVLLIHGDADNNVLPEQSRLMNAALKAAGKDVQLVILPNQGHTGWGPENGKTMLVDAITFIKAHIAPAVVAASANPVAP